MQHNFGSRSTPVAAMTASKPRTSAQWCATEMAAHFRNFSSALADIVAKMPLTAAVIGERRHHHHRNRFGRFIAFEFLQ